MITLFIIALAGTGLLFAAMPVVAFALMLETCAERAAASGQREMETARPRRKASAGRPFAAAA